MKILNIKQTLILPLVFLFSSHVFSSQLDLSTAPIVQKTAPTKPNVLLIFDDSGSMDNSGSYDIFYSPGFNFQKDYTCSSDSNFISPSSSLTMRVYPDFEGVGTFIQNSSEYALKQGAGATFTTSDITEYRYQYSCDVDNNDVRVRFKSCSRKWCNWSAWFNDASYSVGDVGFYCDASQKSIDLTSFDDDYPVPSEDDCQAEIDGDGLSGCRWDASMDPDQPYNNNHYYQNNSGTDRRFQVRSLNYSGSKTEAADYNKTFSGACFYDDLKYEVSLKADNCSDQTVELYNVDTGLSENKTVRVCDSGTNSGDYASYSGKYLNWYFSNSSSDWFSFDDVTQTTAGVTSLVNDVGDLTIDLDAPATNFISDSSDDGFGYRENTDIDYQRLLVAKDVAGIFVGGVKDFEVGLATYDTSDGGQIDRQIEELGDLGTDETNATIAARAQLLSQIDELDGTNWTPLKETFLSAALYYTQGINASNDEDIFNGENAYSLFRGNITVEANYNGSGWDASLGGATPPSPINQDQFCQRNFIIALTDGSPTEDSSIPSKITLDNSTPDLDDITKLLYENDLRPDINDGAADGPSYDNFIKSYLIGFSDSVTNPSSSVYQLLDSAATAGGGAFYPATDGVLLAEAFEKISKEVPEDSLSVTQVAVSSVAELATENFAFQAGFNSGIFDGNEKWDGEVTAFFLTEDGLFKEKYLDYSTELPTVQDATNVVDPTKVGLETDDTGDIQPLWQSSDAINRMYLIQGDTTNNQEFPFYRPLSERVVYTINQSNTAGTEFTVANKANLPSTIISDLNVGALRLNATVDELINYLRGDQSLEIGNSAQIATNADFNEDVAKFRQRTRSTSDVVSISGTNTQVITDITEGSILGDITNSSPVFIQKPPRPWDDKYYGGGVATDGAYSLFQNVNENRTGMLYVGANDGMFHAITTEPKLDNNSKLYYDYGSVVFSYIPSFVASSEAQGGLHYLAEPGYEHRYYVNGTPTASDVYIDLYGAGTPEWRTLIVSGVAQGGKGLFALDVTCPFLDSSTGSSNGVSGTSTCSDESFGANNILWEFTHPRLGNTFSRPIIGKLKYGATGVERWAAIVNNGYNSTDESPALFVIFLDGPGNDGWDEGTEYLILEANTSINTADTSGDNGLSPPQVVDLEADGTIDRIYAGDLKGNLWVWNTSEQNNATNYAGGASWTVNKLFTTQANQAITTTPQISRDPSQVNNTTNLMVMFGSGKLLEDDDILATAPASQTQSVYAIHDRDVFNQTITGLQQRTLVETVVAGTSVRSVTGDPYDVTKFGWYMNLPTTSERVIYDGFAINSLFVFTTFIPDTAECKGGSTGWTMLVDWTTGLAPSAPTFDSNLDGQIDSSDGIYVGFKNSVASSQISRAGDFLLGSSGNNITSVGFNQLGVTIGRRLSWDEKFPFGVLK